MHLVMLSNSSRFHRTQKFTPNFTLVAMLRLPTLSMFCHPLLPTMPRASRHFQSCVL